MEDSLEDIIRLEREAMVARLTQNQALEATTRAKEQEALDQRQRTLEIANEVGRRLITAGLSPNLRVYEYKYVSKNSFLRGRSSERYNTFVLEGWRVHLGHDLGLEGEGTKTFGVLLNHGGQLTSYIGFGKRYNDAEYDQYFTSVKSTQLGNHDVVDAEFSFGKINFASEQRFQSLLARTAIENGVG